MQVRPTTLEPLIERGDQFGVAAFLRWEVAPQLLRQALQLPNAVAWIAISPYNGWPWITAAGQHEGVVRAIAQLADLEVEGYGPPRGLSVPAATIDELPDPLRPKRVDDWTWWSTSKTPPPVPGEEAVQRIDAYDDGINELLRSSASAYLRPGDDRAEAWYGVLDNQQDWQPPISCAAVEQHRDAVPHLASVATDPRHRGRGLATAVCGAVTRAALENGAPAITLAMMTNNLAATSVYRRLGFQAGPRFVSGWLPGRQARRRRDGGAGAAVCG